MSKFRPVVKLNASQYQSRSNFSGSHNNGRRGDDNLLVRANQMLAALIAEAAIFPAPYVDTTTFATDINNFSFAKQSWNVKGSLGSRAQHDALVGTRKQLLIDLASNANYIQAVANSTAVPISGRILTILLGGMSPTRRGKLANPMVTTTFKASQFLPAPTNLRSPMSRHGLSGGVARIRWSKIRGASGYNVYFITNDTQEVRFITTTTATWFQENIGASNSRRYFVTAIGARDVASGRSQTLVAFGKP